MNNADEAILKRASKAVFERLGDGSIFSLPWHDQVVAIIYSAQGVIDNGGFQFFFENDWPDQPPYSVFAEAYRAIGAEECADCIAAAASLFPFPDPHRAEDARREYMETQITDSRHPVVQLGIRVMDHSDANFTLLAQFIRNQREYFGGV